MKPLGRVLSTSGEYLHDRIEITLFKGERVSKGEYLYVEIDGRKIFLQVELNPIRRPMSSYDDKLVRAGLAKRDMERVTWKALCRQVGYEEDERIQPYLFPIPPIIDVYRPAPEEVKQFVSPSEHSIRV